MAYLHYNMLIQVDSNGKSVTSYITEAVYRVMP